MTGGLMRYRIIAAIMILIMLLTSGCVIKKDIKNNTEKGLDIVATIFPAYDFARAVAGDKAKVHMLIKPGSEVHSYEPAPNDIQLINECDIFIYVGGESDSWLVNVLETIDNPHMQIIRMMDYANNIEEEYVEGMQIRDEHHAHSHQEGAKHSEDHEEHQHEYDEHVWTSPKNALEIVKAITDAIINKDTVNKDYYIRTSSDYQSALLLLDYDFCNAVKDSNRKVLVFGDRFPLLHFVKEYGLEYYAAYPGCAAESEPNAKTVAFLIEKVKQENIPVVFHMEMSNEKMTDTICEATGAEKMLFSSCHNVTAEQFESGVTYIDLMKENLKAFKKALN